MNKGYLKEKFTPRIIVHGGAGNITAQAAHRRGVRRAALRGYAVLRESGSALDAVVTAVAKMEDDPTFNCGRGSALGVDGRVEMDAAVMCHDLSCGAVAALERVKNPILVARKVMEQTDHVLLVGRGALQFARRMGFGPFDPVTDKRKRRRELLIQRLKTGGESRFFPRLAALLREGEFGTVGAVAIDGKGHIAAATSTGGIQLHLPGRVGDTALIGAGTYANEHGGVSATGHGESIIRLAMAAKVADLMNGMPAQKAVDRAIRLASKNDCQVGLVAIDHQGRVGFGFNSKAMSYAYVTRGEVTVF